MNRNILPYIAIFTSLVLGTICSTALADNKGNFKFGGGNRNFSGGSNRNLHIGGNKPSNFKIQGNVRPSIGNFNNNIKHHSGGSINKQIVGGLNGSHKFNPKFQQHGGSIQHKIGGIKIGNNSPIHHDKKIGGIKIGSPIHHDHKVGGIKIGTIHHDNHKSHGIKIGIGFDPHCDHHHKPICKPVCKPCKPHCHPIVITCPPCNHHHHSVQTVPVAVPVQVPVQVPVGGQVAPASAEIPVAEEAPMQIPVGATLTLQAAELGVELGQVMLVVDKMSLAAELNEWKVDGVTATLPMMGLVAPTPAEIVILRADGSMASSLKIELVPAQPESAGPGATGAIPAGDSAAAALAGLEM